MRSKLIATTEGWVNVVKQTATYEQLRRQKICSCCEFAVKGRYIAEVGDVLKEVDGLVCDECRCPLIAKIRQDKIICKKW